MKLSVACLMLFSAASLAAPDITFTFDCDKNNNKGAKETCNTMCFGLNCHSIKNEFHYDAASDKTKDDRRAKAGCGKDNRCSKSPYGKGFECDEFPFAMSEEADKGGQINRCVPAADQRSQGGQITQLQTNKKYCNKEKGCKFKLSFKNEGAYKYCKKGPDCKADDNIYNKDGPVKRSLMRRASEGGHYKLRSGVTIYSPSDLPIGTLSLRYETINATLDNELAARDVSDEQYFDNQELVEDEVVEKL